MNSLIFFLITIGVNNGFSFNPNHNSRFKYDKSSINHLDTRNINNLEKLFYLRNNKYSPFKKITYDKYLRNNENVTEILQDLNEDFLNRNSNMDDEFKKIFNNTFNLIENNVNNNNYSVYEKLRSQKFKNIEINPNDDDEEEDDMNSTIYDMFGMYKKSDSYKNRKNEMGGDLGSGGDFEIIKDPTHSFDDIGGYDKIKEELNQVSDILVNYKKYKKYNVRTPKGLIFEGPPGNGKTLLAKGFCGEVKSSFIPVSGSEFTEKYVGVGAGRIRDLFKLAAKNSPCIIFIDEIDALGRKRGNDMVNTNSEKDQTLNQLLISLDGFKENEGVFIIGATNRIDLLDNALLRPGRMDKKIYIGNPDSNTRKAIINIHLKGKPIDKLIDIESLVEMTGGFSGAQIENLFNEAMLKALREDRERIEWYDLEYTANRILVGWQNDENKFSDNMIDRICIHEFGHALVGFLSVDHPHVSKISLNLWSPTAPGFTLFENQDENANINTRDGLISHLAVLLGGRIAEQVFFGNSATTGAKQDLERAYELAKNMITIYGMGEQNIYPDLSDQSKLIIDNEINKILLEANEQAFDIITSCHKIIENLGYRLKNKKTIKAKELFDVVKKNYKKEIDTTKNNQYNYMLQNE